jgi:hypothetical protein
VIQRYCVKFKSKEIHSSFSSPIFGAVIKTAERQQCNGGCSEGD